MQTRRKMPLQQTHSCDVDQLGLPRKKLQDFRRKACRSVLLACHCAAHVASAIRKHFPVRNAPEVVALEATEGISNASLCASWTVSYEQRPNHCFRIVKAHLRLTIMLQSPKSVEEQKRLMRRPPAAACKLPNAIETGEQGRAIDHARAFLGGSTYRAPLFLGQPRCDSALCPRSAQFALHAPPEYQLDHRLEYLFTVGPFHSGLRQDHCRSPGSDPPSALAGTLRQPDHLGSAPRTHESHRVADHAAQRLPARCCRAHARPDNLQCRDALCRAG